MEKKQYNPDKKYINKKNKDLKTHIERREETFEESTSVYFENSDPRPKNATRIWLSYDINDEEAPKDCRKNLLEWLAGWSAESFGASIATFLVDQMYLHTDEAVADWLTQELKDNSVLLEDDDITMTKSYLSTPGISLYVFYRTRNNGNDGELRQQSGHFVLIQNAPMKHKGGYDYPFEDEN